ncbi:MAG: AzlC family ABC transporter permease [Clostridium sp.]
MEGVEEIREACEFRKGIKSGIPICLGYISVSLTFGMIAVRGGLDVKTATLISMTNLTSAGQFAGIEMILNNAMYLELALTTFIINIRYSLMSFAISQKLLESTLLERLVIAFGITDETYTLAATEEGKLTNKFMLGLIIMPYIGWTIGTFVGGISAKIMPVDLQDALGIALYGMFLAIIIPAGRKDFYVLRGIVLSAVLSIGIFYLPILNKISSGFSIIIASIVSAMIIAKIKPIKE